MCIIHISPGTHTASHNDHHKTATLSLTVQVTIAVAVTVEFGFTLRHE